MDDDSNNDDELAPMVDGLSGSLCILILVSAAFMASSTDLIIESDGASFKVRDTYVDFNKNTIHYSAMVSLPSVEIYRLRNELISSKGNEVVFYGAVENSVEQHKEKNTFNLLKLYADLKLPSNVGVTFKYGDVSMCGESLSCIYWQVK